MNYTKRDFAAHKSVAIENVALSPLDVSPPQSSRWAISHRAVAALAMLFDVLIIIATSVLSGIVYHIETIGNPGPIDEFGGFAAVVAVLFITLAKNRDLYTLRELLNLKTQIIQITTKWVGVFLFITAIGFTMKAGEHFSRGATLAFAISGLAALIGTRIVWRIFLANGLARHRFSGRKAILIAEQATAVDEDLVETLTRHGLQLVKHFVLPANQNDVQPRKDVIAEAIASLRGSDIEEIIVGANLDHWSQLSSLLSEFRVLPLPVNFVPVGPPSELFKLSSHTIGDTVTIELQRGPRTPLELLAKRVIDILIAGTALLLFLPLFLMTAIAIKVDSPGQILFRQRRCGFNGRVFHILKFRTMSVLEDGATIVPAQPNDNRVTRLGNWLRRTSIDELPQLVNVLQGNMSIVGPRPHALAHDYQFDKLVGNYAFRQHVKPGLTGWAQVNGHRGQMRSVVDIEQRIKFDLWYIDNWNFALDFRIMLMTVIEIMRGENAY